MEIPKFTIETKGKGEKARNKIIFEDKVSKKLGTYLHKNCGFDKAQISEGMISGILSGLVKMGKLSKAINEDEESPAYWECDIVI
jgi:hypothetical protein